MTATSIEYEVKIRRPHPKQGAFIDSPTPRKVVRAGRRGGKTTGIAILAVKRFLRGQRVLYAAPTQEQIDRFWTEIKMALREAIKAGALYKNETLHIIGYPTDETIKIEDAETGTAFEGPGSEPRIRGKTAWDADSLRGDYADLLILDEYQLMNEDAWGRVGAPMLADNNGDAVFIYTPPSLHSRSRTKARDPQHAAKLFKKAKADDSGRWEAFHFTSFDNPHISHEALTDLTEDMTTLAYEQEILAEDKDEAPGALWTRDLLEATRVHRMPDLARIVIGVDPPGGATECGIVCAGIGLDGDYYVFSDHSLFDSPGEWASEIVSAYNLYEADRVIGEVNFGGDMVENTIRTVEGGDEISFVTVRASRGKAVRAEPIASLYEKGHAHNVGSLPILENEMCQWEPGLGLPSPNRLDAMVWALTELKEPHEPKLQKRAVKGLYKSRATAEQAERHRHPARRRNGAKARPEGW